ncbi:LysR family transcriptional regulator [Sneathiella sp. HT1-7]|uniref:LysR family transcriptional regulator n=1 Tax=Sneathiella sp. HT1-7 TaxID=2887192 RepID=UPI001D14600D|nr:LysR family transcriptional regulator [Sneathiella sp. HT1-7]MCC3306276.1 LysR family transcriptional regulator [Sneathiella sp. HT1-7]
MNVSFRVMRYFAAAAHFKSLTKAAAELNISQSAISLAVDNLEAELGLTLLNRERSKGISLTAKGREVLVRIQAILDQVENFEDEIIGLRENISGHLHVGCFNAIAPIVLAPILKRLVSEHSAIHVNIIEGNVRHIFDSIHRGEIDVGISYDEADISAGLKTKTLAVVPPHVIVPRGHPLAEEKSISLTELIDQPMILLDLPSSRQYYTSLFETAGFEPKFVYKSGNYEMVRSMVGAGLGIALLQSRPSTEDTHCGAKILCKPIKENLRKSRLVVAYTEQGINRRIVKAFVEQCEAYFTTKESRELIVS